MESPVLSASCSGSYDGTVFAKVFLDSNFEHFSPARIPRLAFEAAHTTCNLGGSISSMFPSYYGLPYDDSSPCEEHNQDARSEHSSKGPRTPPTPDSLVLSADTFVPPEAKHTDDPLGVPSTLFLDTRSLLPSHSLLSDTASYLGLMHAPGSPVNPRSEAYVITPQLPAHVQPSSQQPSRPQTTTRETRPSLDSTASHRGVTVHRLALDLPDLCRSRSGSLTALIHALEDASPGWYQSLMENALPGSQPSSTTELEPSLSAHPASSTGTPGLPASMLLEIQELEALAHKIKALPMPRPRTMALDGFAQFLSSGSRALPPSPLTSDSPPPSPVEEARERQRTVVGVPSTLADMECSSTLLPVELSGRSRKSSISNLANHPKLSKTLGLRPQSAGGRPPGGPQKAASWRHGVHSYQPPPRSLPSSSLPPVPPLPASALTQELARTPENDSRTMPPPVRSSKTLKTLFRRRPSAPPVPSQVFHAAAVTAVPRSLDARRAAHLSEPPKPRVDGKISKHTSSAPEVPPLSPTLGSFLPM